MVKPENKLKLERIKIGILGGTFDPAHKGHLEISKQARKRFGLQNIVWAITEQNPFKDETRSNLKSRMKFAKKIIGKNNYIKIKFYEEKIGSNRTIDLIKHLKKKQTESDICFTFCLYYLMIQLLIPNIWPPWSQQWCLLIPELCSSYHTQGPPADGGPALPRPIWLWQRICTFNVEMLKC